MKWKDIKVGTVFADGSKVTQVHRTYRQPCCRVFYENKTLDCSWQHIFKVKIKNASDKIKKDLANNTTYVPLVEDYAILNDAEIPIDVVFELYAYFNNEEHHFDSVKILSIEGHEEEKYAITVYEVVLYGNTYQVKIESIYEKVEPQRIDDDTYWLNCSGIAYLLWNHCKVYSNKRRIKKIKDIGLQDAFCVSTDTGKFIINDLESHNSVTLRDIIFSCIEHNNELTFAGIDLKLVEFSCYKGIKGCAGIANTVSEALEITKIARQAMKKRNREMQTLGLNNLNDYKPKDYTGKIWVTGREYNEDEKIKVRIDGKEQEMTVLDLFNLVQN